MKHKDLSTWALLIAAGTLGSITTATVSAFNPPPAAERSADAEAPAAKQLVAAKSSPDKQAAASPEEVRSRGGDWPQWGGTRERNNVPNVVNLPESWDIGRFDRRSGQWDKSQALNIRWYANLGSQTYGNPVVADGRVFVGTNNGAGHLQRYPSTVDLGCLLAFDEQSGELLWQ